MQLDVFLLLRQVLPPEMIILIICVLAATLTTSSFLPQIHKVYRTKSMEDVAIFGELVGAGTVLWMVYGILKYDWVIIGANSTATAFNVILLYMKFAYRKRLPR